MLLCTAPYRAVYVSGDGDRVLVFQPGEYVVESPDMEAWLLRDGSFEVVPADEAKAIIAASHAAIAAAPMIHSPIRQSTARTPQKPPGVDQPAGEVMHSGNFGARRG
jgi:hypothetical protein